MGTRAFFSNKQSPSNSKFYSMALVVHPFHINVFRLLMVSSEELEIQLQAKHVSYYQRVLAFDGFERRA